MLTSTSFHLNMAGAVWELSAPFPVTADARYAPFLADDAARADCAAVFRADCPPVPDGAALVQADVPRVWRVAEGYLADQRLAYSPGPVARVLYRDDDPLHVEAGILPGQADWLRSLDDLFDAVGVEHLVAALGALILHSSFIATAAGGILFTAPSGTGKSTQAALWERYAAAEQINGDRAVLRRADGVWTAYGFPFAGSSGIFKNKAAPVRAIVVLRQAAENTVERLAPPEAFRLLYSECAIQRWNAAQHAGAVDRLLALARAVPVYRLACTPDARAVALLRETLSAEPFSPILSKEAAP